VAASALMMMTTIMQPPIKVHQNAYRWCPGLLAMGVVHGGALLQQQQRQQQQQQQLQQC
jgi:hypothetical protein